MIVFQNITRTIICMGTGGVGKTTLAATIGLGKASEGKKVLVITIDPSQRLAQALGFSADGLIHEVEFPNKNNLDGKLFATVLQHEKAFQEFIQKGSDNKFSKNEIEKLLKNKLYQQLTSSLSGSQEFTALFKLNEFVESKKYDLVILDTPPAQHLWQFLNAPEKIANLFNEGISSWFRNPSGGHKSFFQKILNTGTLQVLKILETLTGAEFIKELSMFFMAIEKWQAPLENLVMNCHKLMTSSSTEFVIVTTPEPSRALECQKISQEIILEGYRLTTLVLNKVPLYVNEPLLKQTEKIQNLLKYNQSLERFLIETIKSGAGFKKSLNIYKSMEVSQNDLNAKKLSEIYFKIERI